MNNSSCQIPAGVSILQNPSVIWLFGAGYFVVGLLSLIGNSLVIYIVASKREMQTVTNVLIANLAVSDLVITLTSLWITPVYVFNQYDWIFGKAVCYAYHAISGMSIIISSFTLTAIAIDRYLLIIHPFSVLSARPRFIFCVTSIVIVWSSATVMVVPPMVQLKHGPMNVCDTIMTCMEVWAFDNARVAYGGVILILRSVAPFAVIAACYCKITRRLNDMNRRLQNRKRSNYRAEYDDCKRKQSLQRILVAMVILFALCTTPMDLVNLISDLDMKFETIKTENLPGIRLLAHFIHMTGTLWNPLLYAWGNENFKKEIHNRMSSTHHSIPATIPLRTTAPPTVSPLQRGSLEAQDEMMQVQRQLLKGKKGSASSIHL